LGGKGSRGRNNRGQERESMENKRKEKYDKGGRGECRRNTFKIISDQKGVRREG